MTSFIKNFKILAKNPSATLRLVRGSVLAKFGINRIRNCQLALTFVCNHSCEMCSSNLLIKNEKELDLEEWKNITDQLYVLGCTHYDLTGGEPTLKGMNFLTKLIRYINKNNDCIVSMATNAKKLNLKDLSILKNAGLKAIEFNLQSLDSKVHDKIVGDEGNLEHIKKLVIEAKNIKLPVLINTCLGTYNFKEIEKLIKWCEKNNILICLNLTAPTGRLTGKHHLRLTNFKKEYYDLLKKYSNARSDTSFNYRGQNLCPGGIEKLYITTYGEVMQCTFCQIAFGNLRKESLKTIYKRFCTHPLIKERSICKHSFNENFRKEWLNPIENMSIPVKLEDHPNYLKYKSSEE